jgi:homoserine kinase
MVLVRIPASSANLGPGFDCLGLALNLYNYVQMEETGGPLTITLGGRYQEGFALDETNLVYRAAQFLWQKVGYQPSGIALRLINNIPPARGLGSSSAAILGGLAAANILAGHPLDREGILGLATALEGHPDNVAAALYGGVTLAVKQPNGACICRSLGNMEGIKTIIAVPKLRLSTKVARGLLPAEVSFEDAVWNLSRTGLLVTALLNKDYSLLKIAMQDKLHESYRSKAIPGMTEALAAANSAGALGAVLSGAGPTLIAFIPETDNEQIVGKVLQDSFISHGGECEINYLSPDNSGTIELETLAQDSNLDYGGLAC